MRILHVTPYFEQAWAYGGIPRAAAVTVRGLAARGHDVTVCTTDAHLPNRRLHRTPSEPLEPGASAERRVDVRVFRNVSNAAAYHLQFFTPIGLSRYLRRAAGDFDVAHLHGCHHLPGAIAARHLRSASVPYVLTPHGTAPYLERRRLAKRLFDLSIGRGVLRDAARVIAVSMAERRQLIEIGVPEPSIDVIPNPLDLNEFALPSPGTFRRRLELGAQTPLVLFMGKLTAQKRLDVLVRAFAKLEDQDARLVIAGNDMGYGKTLRSLIDSLGIGKRVLVPGLLTGSERAAALGDADVVVYASEGEVFGLVPVEALLCHTPVVVSSDSGCGEVISETGGGLLVEPGNVAALRTAMGTVLSNRSAWRGRAELAAHRARRFSSDAVCAVLEKTYRNVHRATGGRVERAAI